MNGKKGKTAAFKFSKTTALALAISFFGAAGLACFFIWLSIPVQHSGRSSCSVVLYNIGRFLHKDKKNEYIGQRYPYRYFNNCGYSADILFNMCNDI